MGPVTRTKWQWVDTTHKCAHDATARKNPKHNVPRRNGTTEGPISRTSASKATPAAWTRRAQLGRIAKAVRSSSATAPAGRRQRHGRDELPELGRIVVAVRNRSAIALWCSARRRQRHGRGEQHKLDRTVIAVRSRSTVALQCSASPRQNPRQRGDASGTDATKLSKLDRNVNTVQSRSTALWCRENSATWGRCLAARCAETERRHQGPVPRANGRGWTRRTTCSCRHSIQRQWVGTKQSMLVSPKHWRKRSTNKPANQCTAVVGLQAKPAARTRRAELGRTVTAALNRSAVAPW